VRFLQIQLLRLVKCNLSAASSPKQSQTYQIHFQC